jgi:hypothetical protein
MIIYSVIMLITGYFGEVVHDMAAFWGFVSGAAFLQSFTIWLGSASKLAAAAGGEVLKHTKSYVGSYCWMGNLPIRIHDGNNWMVHRYRPAGNIDVAYNIADAINKIGFGLVIYTLAKLNLKD